MTRCVRISRLFSRDGIKRDVTFTERDGLIVSRTDNGFSPVSCDETIEIDGIGFPLFVNSHTHLELTGLGTPGEPPRDLWDWIISVVKAKRSLTDDDFKGNIASGESALTGHGTGIAGDIRSVLPNGPFFNDKLAARMFFELLGYDENLLEQKKANLDIFLRTQPSTLNPQPFLKGISIHSLYTTPFSKAKEVIGFARKKRLPVMIHLGETVFEDRLFFGSEHDGFNRVFPGAIFENRNFQSYADIMEYLDLGPDTILVHCARFSDGDWDRAAERNIPVVLCPRSNRFWGDGLPDFDRVIGSSVRWAIGTDSTLTNADLDVLNDARFIYRRIGGGAHRGMSILNALTYGGRDVLGLPGDGLTIGGALSFVYFPFQPSVDDDIPEYVLGSDAAVRVYPAAEGKGGATG